MEGIAPLGTLDPQHAITQLVKALADPARAFAFVRHRRAQACRRSVPPCIKMKSDRPVTGRAGHVLDQRSQLRVSQLHFLISCPRPTCI